MNTDIVSYYKDRALETPIDRWTYFIKHSVDLHVIPDFANEDEGLKTAFIEADKYQWSKEELKAYDNEGIKDRLAYTSAHINQIVPTISSLIHTFAQFFIQQHYATQIPIILRIIYYAATHR